MGDKPAFAEFIRTEISEMLKKTAPPLDRLKNPTCSNVPVPDMPAPPLPESDAPADLPLPE